MIILLSFLWIRKKNPDFTLRKAIVNKFPKLRPIFFSDLDEVKPDDKQETDDPDDDWKIISTKLREPLLESIM